MKLTTVLAAILICRPGLSSAVATSYAKIIADGAAHASVDPILIVALVDRESGWQPDVVNKKSGAIGLGQILPQFQPAADRIKLFDAAFNLRTVFRIVETWKNTCKAKTGTSLEEQWLIQYSGASPKGSICGRKATANGWAMLPIPSLVQSYLARRQALRQQLGSPP